MIKTIQSNLRQTPNEPGVYRFYDSKNKIIYIGKAKKLRNRIRSYFRNTKNQSSKTVALVKKINHFDWIVVRSEVEALMTEANLIKQNKPKYNIELKDDKTYPYIRITREPFPQVILTRQIIRDGSKYFGPFTDIARLRMTLKAIYKVFPIRSCSYLIDTKTIKEKKISLCLDYHIKKCEGPCEGLVTENQYAKMINRVEEFMKGRTEMAKKHIKRLMDDAVSKQFYEEAALRRDQLFAIKSFKDKQRSISADFSERDMIALAKNGEIGIAVILRIRDGKIFSREKLSLINLDNNDENNLNTIITRFYLNSDFIPSEITMQYTPKDEASLLMWLKNKRKKTLKFTYPKRGDKAKELRITYQNARLLLGEWMLNRIKHRDQIPGVLGQLKSDLHLDNPPKHIEAFDVSHLGGTNTVASMVYFQNAKPIKKQYRRYNIKSIEGIDDYAAIREVVYRRYRRLKKNNDPLPDLILIDGGKGQLSMAVSALRELGLEYIPVIGLAKKLEEIFIPGYTDPQSINKQSKGLLLLRRIRDEAHRFAINFQRSKRKNYMKDSIFKEIPGMGVKRINTLLTNFDSIDVISNLSPESINGETGIPLSIAKNVVLIAKKNLNNEDKVR